DLARDAGRGRDLPELPAALGHAVRLGVGERPALGVGGRVVVADRVAGRHAAVHALAVGVGHAVLGRHAAADEAERVDADAAAAGEAVAAVPLGRPAVLLVAAVVDAHAVALLVGGRVLAGVLGHPVLVPVVGDLAAARLGLGLSVAHHLAVDAAGDAARHRLRRLDLGDLRVAPVHVLDRAVHAEGVDVGGLAPLGVARRDEQLGDV